MCRLLGVSTRKPEPIADAVPAVLGEFRELSHRHCDGWGAAWRPVDEDLVVRHGPRAAWQDDDYAATMTGAVSDQEIVHLRRASAGMAVVEENCHPFSEGDVAFEHNGYVRMTPRLLTWCEDVGVRRPRGITDSEWYFGIVLHHARTMSWPEAIATAARQLTQDAWVDDPHDDPEALNCLLSTPDALYAFAQSNPRKLKPESTPDAYELRMLVAPDRVVVTSSQWNLPGSWALPERHVYQIDRGTLRVTDHGQIPLG